MDCQTLRYISHHPQVPPTSKTASITATNAYYFAFGPDKGRPDAYRRLPISYPPSVIQTLNTGCWAFNVTAERGGRRVAFSMSSWDRIGGQGVWIYDGDTQRLQYLEGAAKVLGWQAEDRKSVV